MTRLAFHWVDVFADEPLTGNPLALVPNADELTDDRMRAITREFNQSETTFLVAPTREGVDHRLRSFTAVGAEVLGAGHNAMGAWIWLAESGALDADREHFTQQIGDDVLDVRIARADDGRARVSMQQSAPRFLAETNDHAALASALGLPLDAFVVSRAAHVVSTGAEHLLVAVVSEAAVDAATPNSDELLTLLAGVGAEGCYVYASTPHRDDLDGYSRFFNPTVGIVEDPATGTAAGPLAALLVRDGLTAERTPIRIEQGRAIGRPSILEVTVDGDRVELSGSGLVIADGTLHL